MAIPYVGEIRMFGGNFAPLDWQFCDGSILSIAENEVLFQLIGTTYGGDGQSTFGVPDLRGRAPIHQGTGPLGVAYFVGETGGVEEVTLSTTQMPLHNHPAGCNSGPGNSASPANAVPAQNSTALAYAQIPPQVNMNPGAIQSTGGSQPHDNMQPYLCVSFIISLVGIFPSPN